MDKKDKTIVFVGSLNENKAPDVLIKAWAQIEKNIQNGNWSSWVVVLLKSKVKNLFINYV